MAKASNTPAPLLTPAAAGQPEASTVKDLMDLVTSEAIDTMRGLINTSFDERARFEHAARPANETIQEKLKAGRARLTTHYACQGLVALNVDPGFLNRELNDGKRYNIYAVGKLYDALSGITAGNMTNAINLAVMKSMFRFRAAGVPFTGAVAQAAASDKIKVEAALNKLLVRHTVSAATAPTQTSSTMNALQTLGVVANHGNAKFPIYHLIEGPQTRALEKLCA